ncbi:Retrovirus-related Pol polyprotein from transposon TNT 1-94 [Melia azedarach]|uniref:Retrovirus-related Pol polyprotein from transposon TNT 1-94 n=1 Tax=Melia azedarach TaxID=155640 RepID=A0ACC1XXG5_MELAZ|nr:Retrovirus-related Pol polyprotein from transposon TNT 1-94 [Melia azedarach]
MSGMNVKIDKFTGRNSFSLWQIKMRALLKQQGLWAPLARKPADPITAEMAVLEEKAHSTIMLCLADDIITEVAEEETAQGLWVKLEGLYMTKSLTNKLLLKQRLFSLRMQEGMPLRDHLDQLNTILLELRNIDVKVEDEDAALILLVSLPLSYENFVQSFIVGKDTVSLEEVRSSLHTRELRHKATGIGADNQAAGLVASGSYGHGNSGKKKFKKPVSKGPKPNDVCNYCKEKGHWKSDCPKKKRQQDKPTGTAAVADTNSEEDIALVADEHTDHNDVDGGNISMANSYVCKAVGIGSIKIRTHDGKFCTLNDVKHVPLMTKNLISLSMLDNKGFSFQGEGGVLHVCKGSNVVLKGVKRGTLYFLQGSTLSSSVAVASSEIDKDNMTKLWLVLKIKLINKIIVFVLFLSATVEVSEISGKSIFLALREDEAFPNGQILPTPNLRILSFAELKAATRNFKGEILLGEEDSGKYGLTGPSSNQRCSLLMLMCRKIRVTVHVTIYGVLRYSTSCIRSAPFQVTIIIPSHDLKFLDSQGYSWEDQDLYLVHEFVTRRNLANHLFGRTSYTLSARDIQLKIALGAVRGLTCWHT